MSVTCGFYNSLNGDRKYKSSQFSMLFDGIIKDGIFMSVGDAFNVTAGSGNTVNVGSGLAWFNHTWTHNDALLPIDCGESNTLMDRIDAIVIKIDSSDSVRENTIEVYKGVAATNPVNPTFPNDNYTYYYPLCYITRKAGSTEITQGNITNARGIETDYVTGILETLDKEQLLLQWRSELDEFVANEEQTLDKKYSEVQDFLNAIMVESETWSENQRNTILAWFEGIQDVLESNTAIKLEEQIRKSDIERMLKVGLTDGVKTFSEGGVNSGPANLWTYGDVIGTRYKTITDIFIKSGRYTITADVESSDTDSEKSSIQFVYSDDTKPIATGFIRGEGVTANVTLEKDVNKVHFYAAVGADISKNDTFSFKNITLTDRDATTTTVKSENFTITTVDSAGRRLVKEFSSDFSSCTTTLYAVEGGELGRLIKNFSSDGSTISSELTIF